MATNAPTAADIRAELARHRLKLYLVAARVGIHPANLSMMLNEHRPLSSDLAQRLMQAIDCAGIEAG
jgi:plasmid maintenance system antidote protein VapI